MAANVTAGSFGLPLLNHSTHTRNKTRRGNRRIEMGQLSDILNGIFLYIHANMSEFGK